MYVPYVLWCDIREEGGRQGGEGEEEEGETGRRGGGGRSWGWGWGLGVGVGLGGEERGEGGGGRGRREGGREQDLQGLFGGPTRPGAESGFLS